MSKFNEADWCNWVYYDIWYFIAILEIPPAENNGTMGRLHHILKNPPTITKVSTGQSGKLFMLCWLLSELDLYTSIYTYVLFLGNICRVPQDSNVVTARTTCSACVCSSCDVSVS